MNFKTYGEIAFQSLYQQILFKQTYSDPEVSQDIVFHLLDLECDKMQWVYSLLHISYDAMVEILSNEIFCTTTDFEGDNILIFNVPFSDVCQMAELYQIFLKKHWMTRKLLLKLDNSIKKSQPRSDHSCLQANFYLGFSHLLTTHLSSCVVKY